MSSHQYSYSDNPRLVSPFFPRATTPPSSWALISSDAVAIQTQHNNNGSKMRKVSRSSAKSYRHTTTINILPDDVLLEIFDFCRIERNLDGTSFRPGSEWIRLVHVCQRWRHIVFVSPGRLDLTLFCTYGTPVRRRLGCWPPFPIIVDYFKFWDHESPASKYEDDVIAALEHPDRLRSIKLAVTNSLLGMVTPVMQEPLPILTELLLSSKDRNPPALPDLFLGGSAPRLKQIYLAGISFPALPNLLLSTNDLVDLRLEDIPQGGYISPKAMVNGLAALSRLESLWIWFKAPTSPLGLRYRPFTTRHVLPSLITFEFRGSSEYLEHLLARINTPRLDCLEITYFNQLDFWVPQLSQFVGRTENLELARSRRARVRVHLDNIYLELGCEEKEHSRSRLTLRISCKWLDWQVSHLSQILGQSLAMVSNVDHLSVDGVGLQLGLESGRQDELEDTDWLELFRLFTAVKTLYGSKQLAGHIALALDGISGEMVAGVLQSLYSLWLEGQLQISVERFLAVRQLSGDRVSFVDPAAGDFLIDGFVTHTFTPRDAFNYFTLLFGTQHFVQNFGIEYLNGAWYLTRNVNLVQAFSSGIPLRPTPFLDYNTRLTRGTVVPQQRWTPADEVDVRRFVQAAVLLLPVFFVNCNGSIGFPLSDILRGCDRELRNPNDFAPLGGRVTTHIRINWPGYQCWRRQIPTRDDTHARNPITVARLMRHVGTSVDKFFSEYMTNGTASTVPRWQIGMQGGITQTHVKVIGVINVSAGSWMPILQLDGYVI